MGQHATVTPTQVSSAPRTPKAKFLESYERELTCTQKVLRALPPDQSGFRPHERSNTAFVLAWTFVVESRMLLKGLKGEEILGSGFGKPPEAWADLMDEVDKVREEVIENLRDASNPNLEGSVTFFTGPKQVGQYSLDDFAWFMLHDHIHHRGQLSVYVRMCGGKVPSIYGPSADEPWN